jgi:hypothetical protein
VVSLTAPGSIDFGSVLYGQTSPGVGISIANNGTVATTIQHLDLQGGGQGAFTIVDDTCTGKTLQPGAQCTVAVSFQPVAAAGNTGSVLVTYSGSSTPLSISLGGHGYYLQLSIPTIQATWDDPGTTTQRMVTLSNGTACATATHFSSAFLIDSGAAMNAVSTIANAPLSQPRLVHTIRYTNNGALVWQAQLFVQIVGVGTGSVQVQVTAQTMGQGSAFQILTPMVTPVVSQVDQCPAGLAPPDISP